MKRKILLAGVAALVLGLMVAPASAWIIVPDYGETGWQSYTYTAGAGGFSGTAGFLVSNHGDTDNDSGLLVDNLSQCSQAGNQSFELGNYDGYTLGPASNGTVTQGPVNSDSGTPYLPADGEWMSYQLSNDDPTPAIFLNAYGNVGTNCSYLETGITLLEGESFTFDWAFLAFDYAPFQDFSKFYLKDAGGDVVFQNGLGQLVPVPPAVVLFGSGLLGLVGLRRFRKN
ncbi:MAG: hypothetical protein M0P73_12325 [Syntrophobacterales bacterium]|jgi:hypothetical protein|nr:hypothetical protein [Syntrophobacterales bacterium]